MRKFLALSFLLFGCGGSKAEAPAPTSAPVAAPAETPAKAPEAKTASAEDEHDDPAESDKPIPMEVVFPAAPKFPAKKVDEAECWKNTSLSGQHDKDYSDLVGKCGGPAGLVEYAKPVVGKLHHKKDQRDTFTLKLKGGLCYRYFAVADDTIKDLDILITSKGSLVGEDKASSPVAIIDATKSWCQADDVEYEFHIEVDGVGKGRYTFGVWARKK